MNKKNLFKLGLLAVSCLGALVIMEVALRLMHYDTGLLDVELFVETKNELMPYKLKPNYRGYSVGKLVNTDSEGNRLVVAGEDQNQNNDLSPEKTKTILILGDSVVFGFGLRDNETIASQLQTLMNQKGANFVIKNIAAPGYSSWNEYEALRLYLEKNHADIVVLVYINNDVTYSNHGIVGLKKQTDSKYNSKYRELRKFLYKNIYSLTLVERMAGSVIEQISAKSHSKKRDSSKILERKISKTNTNFKNPHMLNYSLEAISKIKSLCESKNINFYVAVPRYALWYYEDRKTSDQYEKVMLENLARIGVEGFITTSHTDNLTVDEMTVFKRDYHPSPLAVRYFVNELYEKILSQSEK